MMAILLGMKWYRIINTSFEAGQEIGDGSWVDRKVKIIPGGKQKLRENRVSLGYRVLNTQRDTRHNLRPVFK